MKYTFVLLVVFQLLAISSNAQMKAPEEWLNYESVLGVKNNQRFYDFDVYCIKTSGETNIFYPGDSPKLTFQLVNNTGEAIAKDGKFDVIRCGANGLPNDIWLPEMVKLQDVQQIAVKVNIPAKGFMDIQVEPSIPETFGAYTLVLDLGIHGRRLATSLVRTFRPNPKPIQYPKQSLDDLGAFFLACLGVFAFFCKYHDMKKRL